MNSAIAMSEIYEGLGSLPWKLTVVYRGVEKKTAFPTKAEAESYLAFLTAWEDELSIKLEIS